MWTLALTLLLSAADAHPEGDPRRTPVVEAVQRATPAVVTIQAEVPSASPFLRFGAERRASEGSGVLIGADGVVLTNAHVVDGAVRVVALLSDGRRFVGEVRATEPDLDLAVVQLEGASDLPTIPMGDSRDLMLGEPAIAIGNPFGLGLTVSTGVVASVGRDMQVGGGPSQTYVQTDAAINPGNSGGALVNLRGELIGINTFIHSSAEGIGFAIPVNRVRKVAEDLLLFGHAQVPWLACSLVDVDPRRLPRRLRDGAVLVQVVHAGGALRPGDLVVGLDGHRVATRADVNARLAELRPGARVTLEVVRGDDLLELTVDTGRPPDDLGPRLLREGVGIGLRLVQGRLVAERVAPGGGWARVGLREGDVVLAVNNQRVRDVADVERGLLEARALHSPSVWITVQRDRFRGTTAVPL